MVPTLTATLGVKGHRPTVGTWGNKPLAYVLAVVHLASAARHANVVDSPKGARAKTGQGKTRRWQAAFAAPPRHVGKAYPAGTTSRVVVRIDNAPWHAGQVGREALADHPHLERKRLPTSTPQLTPVERRWEGLRRRATHTRLFDTPADLRRSLRNALRYFQTARSRIRTRLNGRPKKRTASTGS
jgi:hypothetical protein